MQHGKKIIIIIALMIIITIGIIIFPQLINYINKENLKSKTTITQIKQNQVYKISEKDILQIYNNVNSQSENYTIQNLPQIDVSFNNKNMLNEIFKNSQLMQNIINNVDENTIEYSRQRVLYILNSNLVNVTFTRATAKFALPNNSSIGTVNCVFEENTKLVLEFNVIINYGNIKLSDDEENIKKDIENYYLSKTKSSNKDYLIYFTDENSFYFWNGKNVTVR